jgi:pyruvate/2-oxoglutarate dehydrogenase complex dihydrolipoamide acyltransferase (E2) component
MEMRDSLDLGLTIDERIADGYYYAKTVRLLRKLLEEPQLLELPLSQEVEY